ncbi:MAG TPA: DUF4157 domain-containing protein [Blastocatellia bacterium]|nr:DUF4157 domain-containing protein [Blastocatellia bacterium]
MTGKQQKRDGTEPVSESKRANAMRSITTPSEQIWRNPQEEAVIQRAMSDPYALSARDVVQLQQTIGNRAVQRLLSQDARRSPQHPVQAKLTVGPANDRYEQEADRVAAQVINQLNTPLPTPDAGQNIQRQQPKEDEELKRKPLVQLQPVEGGMDVSPDLEVSIQAARGRGQTLDKNLRTSMESAFGADFSGVKVHSDAEADMLNRSVQARAFTTGQDIFFRQGEYNPGSMEGRLLLAHELTHVVQQSERTIGNRAAARLLDGARPLAQPSVASGSRAVQRSIWSEWEPQLSQVAPTTERIAKLGMCIVDFLRQRTGVNVRIGGSLSAVMFGGRRKPQDIDIDIPNGLQEVKNSQTIADLIKSRLMLLGQDVALTTGKDLFFIESAEKTRSGFRLVYRHTKTLKALDPLEDEDEIKVISETMSKSAPYGVDIDFSPEEIFGMSGLTVDSEGDQYGYYRPEFLLAAYLNRLALNSEKKDPDTKDDRGQITSLLSRLLSDFLKQRGRQETGVEAMKAFLLRIKTEVMEKHVQKTNTRLLSQIDELFNQIIQAVIEKFYFV